MNAAPGAHQLSGYKEPAGWVALVAVARVNLECLRIVRSDRDGGLDFFQVGCGEDATRIAQSDSAKVELESAENFGVRGTATFLKTTGGVEVKLDVRNLPKPDTIYLAHIHSGSCG